MKDKLHAIQSASRLTGVPIEEIRDYEKEGLLIPHVAASGRRWFTDNDLQKIRSIRELLRRGKTFNDILRLAALIPCWSFPKCHQRDKIQAACEAKQDFLQPCWILTKEQHNPDQECRLCEVYQRIEDFADLNTLLPPSSI